MYRILRRIFESHDGFPTTSLVLLTTTLIALLQIPASYVMSSFSLSMGIMANELLVIAGVPLLITFWRREDAARIYPLLRPPLHLLLVILLLTIGTDIVIDYLTAASELFFPLPEPYRRGLEMTLSASTPLEIFWKLILLCVLPGICEEIFFRGFCQTSLTARLGPTKAIIATSLLFALLHGNPWYFHLYFLLGVLLSWIFATTGTLLIPIFCHILNNAWTFLNHVRGIAFPLYSFTHLADLMFMILGMILVGFGIMALSAQTSQRRLPLKSGHCSRSRFEIGSRS